MWFYRIKLSMNGKERILEKSLHLNKISRNEALLQAKKICNNNKVLANALGQELSEPEVFWKDM